MSQAPASGDRGIILVIVLWSITIMTVIVVALSAYGQRNLATSSVETDRLRSEVLLRSAVEAAAARIMSRKPEARIFLDGSPERLDLGDGRLVDLRIRDATGLADINRAEPEFLKAVLVKAVNSSEQGARLAELIVEHRKQVNPVDSGGQDPTAQPPAPAETGQPAGAQPEGEGDVPAFLSMAELYGVANLRPRQLADLRQWIGLYSHGGRLNPMAAPEALLRSVPGLAEEEIARILAARRRQDATSPELLDVITAHEAVLSLEASPAYVVSASLVAGPGVIAGDRLEATIMLNEGGEPAFHVVALSW